MPKTGSYRTLAEAFTEPYIAPEVPNVNPTNSAQINSISSESIDNSINLYSIQSTDNFDLSNALQLYFDLPMETVEVIYITLDIYFTPYRGYNRANVAESTHTHDFTHFHDISHTHTLGSFLHQHSLPNINHSHTVTTAPGTTSFYNTIGNTGTTSASGVVVDAYFGNDLSQSTNNTASGSPHTHGVDYGIFEDTYGSNITIKIDGIDRTTALGGSWNPNTTPAQRILRSLNITPYIRNNSNNKGIHLIQLASAQNGRATMQIYVKHVLKN